MDAAVAFTPVPSFSCLKSHSNTKTKISPIVLFQLYSASTTTPSPTLSTCLTTKHKFTKRFFSSPKAAYSASASSVGNEEYIVEPTTDVKFETSLSLPGCSSTLALLGAGYREKVFAIIGVKVYAVGLYANLSVIEDLNDWRGRSEAKYQEDPSFSKSIYQAPKEKALKIVLVRDIDGRTFWDALNDAISSRNKAPSPADESALSTFRGIFQGRPLNKGTVIYLVWLEPSKMLASISSDGSPSAPDATIESTNINFALFDVFFGDAPVSPSLKEMVCNGLAKILI